MKVLKTALLVLSAALLLVGGWAGVLVMSAERTVLNPEYYRELLDEADLASHLQQAFLADLQERFPEEMPAEAQAAILGAFAHAFPPEWLREQLLLVSNDLVALVKGRQAELTAVIDLQGGKERLAESLTDALDELSSDMLMLETDPELSHSEAAELMVEEMLHDMPDQLSLAELLAEAPPEAHQAIAQLQHYRSYYLVVPYVLVAVLFLLCVGLTGLPGGLKWFGTTALISSAAFLCGLLLIRPVLLAPSLAETDPRGAAVLLSTAEFTINKVVVFPIAYAVIGLVLFLGGVALRTKAYRL